MSIMIPAFAFAMQIAESKIATTVALCMWRYVCVAWRNILVGLKLDDVGWFTVTSRALSIDACIKGNIGTIAKIDMNLRK
jgi:hypothetical protein